MGRNHPPVGIISALSQELMAVASETAGKVVELAGMRFFVGHLGEVPTVFVECGVGKVNAAIAATLLAQHFGVSALAFTGVAGGLDPALEVGDVVVARKLVQHDYGALVGGKIVTYQPGAFPLPEVDATHGYYLEPALEARLAAAIEGIALPVLELPGLAPRTPRLLMGTVITGDSFLNCEPTRQRFFTTYGAQAVEMEGAALAQVAERFGLPCLVIRSLSDLAGQSSHVDIGAFLPHAAENAAIVLRALLPEL